MNISAAIISAAVTLNEAGVAEARREAASLLAFVLKKDAAYLIAHPEYTLTQDESNEFESVLKRRAGREPFQYITRRQEFYGLEFEITPAVLIPRPETEILVESAIDTLSLKDNPTLLEIGVGSGCISISILCAVLNASALGIDISEAALVVTRRNAWAHKVSDRLITRRADMFDGLDGKFDLMVSNPPYIPDRQIETLQAEVRQCEPLSALAGGRDGLDLVRRIIRESPRFIQPKGYLLIEIGFGQAAQVKKLFDEALWKPVAFLPDLQGIPRVARARLRQRA